MTGIRLAAYVMDTPDPARLAAFYADLLGGRADVDHDGSWADVALPNGGQLCFQQAPDLVPPRWPDAAHPQQTHLDLVVDDRAIAHARAIELGATLLDDNGGQPRDFWVYADLDGHPFCLCGGAAGSS